METEITQSNFLTILGQGYVGIVWVTEDPLEDRPELFKDMDYLMDGVLTKFINSHSFAPSKKNLFIGKSFGQPFYLIQLEANLHKLNEEAKSLVKIAVKDDDERKKMMVLNKSNAKIDKELAKAFVDHQFVVI